MKKNNKNLLGSYPISFNKEQDVLYFYYSLLANDSNIIVNIDDMNNQDYTTCDIGCGIGLAPILTGVCNPNINSWGFDYDENSIVNGQNLINAAQVDNVNLLKCNFKEFIKADTPDFDLITIHGILSWVTNENKNEVLDIIKTKLKPGGLIYVSYNCLAGWAPILPMRQFFKDYQKLKKTSEINAINQSLEIINEMLNDDILYPKGSKERKLFNGIFNSPRDYLIHEYMTEDWSLYTFPEIHEKFSNLGLMYVGSTDLTRAFDPLQLNNKTLNFLKSTEDTLIKETLRDQIMSPMVRRDVFANGLITKKNLSKKELLLKQNFTLIKPAINIPHEFNFPLGTISITHDIYNLITSYLSQNSYSATDLVKIHKQKSRSKPIDPIKVLEAIQLLVVTNYVMPTLSNNLISRRRERTNKFNKAVLKLEKTHNINVPCFASPIIGGGITRKTDITLLPSLGIEF